MSNPSFWRRWAAIASAASVLALLGGCVMAPVDPWDVGEPMAVSGTMYYGNVYRSYPDYYYYPAPPVSLSLHGNSYRRYRGARHNEHRRAERRYRHGHADQQHRPNRHDRGENRSRHDRGSASQSRDATHRRGNSGARHDRPTQRPRAGEGSRAWTGRTTRGSNSGVANRPSPTPAAGQPRRGNQLGSRQRGNGRSVHRGGGPMTSRGGSLR